MLRQPTLVAGHGGGDAQGEALLAQQGVSPVADCRMTRSPAPPGSARCLLLPVAGQGTSAWPGARGHPHRVQARHRTTTLAQGLQGTARPIRVMIHMSCPPRSGGIGQLHPDVRDMEEPRGPMLKGTTYIVRPRMQPSKSPRERGLHLPGLDPVVGRPGVGLRFQATDKRAVLYPRHVAGVGAGQVAVWDAGSSPRRMSVPASTISAHRRSYSPLSRRTSGSGRAESTPRTRRPKR